MKFFTLFVALTILMVAQDARTELYQWVAEDGSITFKDTPPPASRKSKKVKVYQDSDFAPAPPIQPEPASKTEKKKIVTAQQQSSPKGERFTGTVDIYVTDWCGYCKQALKYMKSKGIPYAAYDIEKDSAAKQRHKELGGRGVPLIIIGSHKMSGYSQQTLEYYLDGGK
jgi:glutaredoxin-like YruB-family protein